MTQAAKAPDRIRETAEEFEGIFLSTLMQTMFANLETDGPFGGGKSEEMYQSMMVEQYGAAVARNGGIGIADAITRQMLAYQEMSQ
jgi:Rod binding domain-containing protein